MDEGQNSVVCCAKQQKNKPSAKLQTTVPHVAPEACQCDKFCGNVQKF